MCLEWLRKHEDTFPKRKLPFREIFLVYLQQHCKNAALITSTMPVCSWSTFNN